MLVRPGERPRPPDERALELDPESTMTVDALIELYTRDTRVLALGFLYRTMHAG